jgi:hypothetical protein
MDLLDRIYRLDELRLEGRNTLRSYLPYRSKDYRREGDVFDYAVIAGKVLGAFVGKT